MQAQGSGRVVRTGRSDFSTHIKGMSVLAQSRSLLKKIMQLNCSGPGPNDGR